MKTQDIEKLAVMTFEALVNGDSASARKMATSVPRYLYDAADYNYTRTLNRLFDVAAMWSVEYWKCYAKMIAAVGLADVASKSDDANEVESAKKLEELWEGRLCALGRLLVSLTESHSIESDAITSFADAHRVYGLDISSNELSEDAYAYFENFRIYFESLIDETDTPQSVDDYFANRSPSQSH